MRKSDEMIRIFLEKKALEIERSPETYNRLRTILKACGWTRRGKENLTKIQSAFETAGIFPEPRLTTPHLSQDAIIRYLDKKPDPYTDQYYAPQMGFPNESSFSEFIKNNFRRIDAFADLKDARFEHRIPGKRIDLLCRDRETEAYVAMEFKRDGDDAVDQLVGYMRRLRAVLEHDNDRSDIRGIVVHFGPEWPRKKALEREVNGFAIAWYRVIVSLSIKSID